ncbi:MAG: diguanylate cyclase [Armatimonadota bacterium]|nr:diguanylate cyclase [Armatimonadota bacterium]
MRFLIRGITLRHRIFLAIVGVSLVVLISALAITSLVGSRVVQGDLARLAESSGRRLEESFHTRQAGLVSQTRLLADLPIARAVLGTRHRGTIEYFLSEQRAKLRADVLMATDQDGRVLGVDPPNFKARDVPRHGGVLISPGMGGSRVRQMAGAPVTVEGRIRGFLIAAYDVDDQVARTFKRSTGSEVTFFHRGAICGSTWVGEERSRLARYVSEFSEAKRGAVVYRDTVRGRHVGIQGQVRVGAPRGDLAYVVEFSELEARGLFAVAQKLLLLLAIPACFVAAAVARRLSTRIAEPIEALVSACQAIEAGEWPDEVVHASTPETGLLIRTFNKAVSSMKAAVGRDSLTGLYNHRYFHERLRKEVALANESHSALSVIMIDLDWFKQINDSFGHIAGDRVITDMAQLISGMVGEREIACRYGGEEFAVIVPGRGIEKALALADKLRSVVAGNKFDAGVDLTITLSASIGVAEHSIGCGDAQEVVIAADVALYDAKQSGRNRVSRYDELSNRVGVKDPQELDRLLRQGDSMSIETLAALMDARPRYTDGHADRVRRYAFAIGKSMGLSPEELTNLEVAALLHDVGKIRVPGQIIDKPAQLTAREREVIESHPRHGESLVRTAVFSEAALPAILHHHERYDGLGYPSHLTGKAIPLLARIIAVADSYDAMTSERPYRGAMTPEKAVGLIRENSGTQFDPELVDVFVSLVSNEKAVKRLVGDTAEHPAPDNEQLAA